MFVFHYIFGGGQPVVDPKDQPPANQGEQAVDVANDVAQEHFGDANNVNPPDVEPMLDRKVEQFIPGSDDESEDEIDKDDDYYEIENNDIEEFVVVEERTEDVAAVEDEEDDDDDIDDGQFEDAEDNIIEEQVTQDTVEEPSTEAKTAKEVATETNSYVPGFIKTFASKAFEVAKNNLAYPALYGATTFGLISFDYKKEVKEHKRTLFEKTGSVHLGAIIEASTPAIIDGILSQLNFPKEAVLMDVQKLYNEGKLTLRGKEALSAFIDITETITRKDFIKYLKESVVSLEPEFEEVRAALIASVEKHDLKIPCKEDLLSFVANHQEYVRQLLQVTLMRVVAKVVEAAYKDWKEGDQKHPFSTHLINFVLKRYNANFESKDGNPPKITPEMKAAIEANPDKDVRIAFWKDELLQPLITGFIKEVFPNVLDILPVNGLIKWGVSKVIDPMQLAEGTIAAVAKSAAEKYDILSNPERNKEHAENVEYLKGQNGGEDMLGYIKITTEQLLKETPHAVNNIAAPVIGEKASEFIADGIIRVSKQSGHDRESTRSLLETEYKKWVMDNVGGAVRNSGEMTTIWNLLSANLDKVFVQVIVSVLKKENIKKMAQNAVRKSHDLSHAEKIQLLAFLKSKEKVSREEFGQFFDETISPSEAHDRLKESITRPMGNANQKVFDVLFSAFTDFFANKQQKLLAFDEEIAKLSPEVRAAKIRETYAPLCKEFLETLGLADNPIIAKYNVVENFLPSYLHAVFVATQKPIAMREQLVEEILRTTTKDFKEIEKIASFKEKVTALMQEEGKTADELVYSIRDLAKSEFGIELNTIKLRRAIDKKVLADIFSEATGDLSAQVQKNIANNRSFVTNAAATISYFIKDIAQGKIAESVDTIVAKIDEQIKGKLGQGLDEPAKQMITDLLKKFTTNPSGAGLQVWKFVDTIINTALLNAVEKSLKKANLGPNQRAAGLPDVITLLTNILNDVGPEIEGQRVVELKRHKEALAALGAAAEPKRKEEQERFDAKLKALKEGRDAEFAEEFKRHEESIKALESTPEEEGKGAKIIAELHLHKTKTQALIIAHEAAVNAENDAHVQALKELDKPLEAEKNAHTQALQKMFKPFVDRLMGPFIGPEKRDDLLKLLPEELRSAAGPIWDYVWSEFLPELLGGMHEKTMALRDSREELRVKVRESYNNEAPVYLARVGAKYVEAYLPNYLRSELEKNGSSGANASDDDLLAGKVVDALADFFEPKGAKVHKGSSKAEKTTGSMVAEYIKENRAELVKSLTDQLKATGDKAPLDKVMNVGVDYIEGLLLQVFLGINEKLKAKENVDPAIGARFLLTIIQTMRKRFEMANDPNAANLNAVIEQLPETAAKPSNQSLLDRLLGIANIKRDQLPIASELQDTILEALDKSALPGILTSLLNKFVNERMLGTIILKVLETYDDMEVEKEQKAKEALDLYNQEKIAAMKAGTKIPERKKPEPAVKAEHNKEVEDDLTREFSALLYEIAKATDSKLVKRLLDNVKLRNKVAAIIADIAYDNMVGGKLTEYINKGMAATLGSLDLAREVEVVGEDGTKTKVVENIEVELGEDGKLRRITTDPVTKKKEIFEEITDYKFKFGTSTEPPQQGISPEMEQKIEKMVKKVGIKSFLGPIKSFAKSLWFDIQDKMDRAFNHIPYVGGKTKLFLDKLCRSILYYTIGWMVIGIAKRLKGRGEQGMPHLEKKIYSDAKNVLDKAGEVFKPDMVKDAAANLLEVFEGQRQGQKRPLPAADLDIANEGVETEA